MHGSMNIKYTIHIASMFSVLPNGLLDSAAKRITSRRTRCKYCSESSDCNRSAVATRVPTRTPLTCVRDVSSFFFAPGTWRKNMTAKSGVYILVKLKILTFVMWRQLVRDMCTDISEGLAICIVNVQEPQKFGHNNFSLQIIEIMFFLCVNY